MPNHTCNYEIRPARYAKGKLAIHCQSNDEWGWKTDSMRLAETVGGRYSGRENAYIVSQGAAEAFQQLHAEGWTGGIFARNVSRRDGENEVTMTYADWRRLCRKKPSKAGGQGV